MDAELYDPCAITPVSSVLHECGAVLAGSALLEATASEPKPGWKAGDLDIFVLSFTSALAVVRTLIYAARRGGASTRYERLGSSVFNVYIVGGDRRTRPFDILNHAVS